MSAQEYNFDGLVGPTHHYGGLSHGNVASMSHKEAISNPRQAALQGLQKMECLHELGIPQAVLPPHQRPAVWVLRQLGFTGDDATVVAKAYKQDPKLLSLCSSSSFMWTANASTITPSADTTDGRVHITPANLTNQFHRSFEQDFTAKVLKTIFADDTLFVHHDPLPSGYTFSDEGAANHTRLCPQYGDGGIALFVYGRHSLQKNLHEPQKFPARQSFEASQAIARSHGLSSRQVVFAKQNPEAIDAGVFHNDVISVGNQNVFFYHELAFIDTERIIQDLKTKYANVVGGELHTVCVTAAEASLKEVVSSYLFNSQIVSPNKDTMVLIAPIECSENPVIKTVVDRIVAENNPIKEVKYLDLRQSMQNGGGPACLRLRVVLTDKEQKALNPGVVYTKELHQKLQDLITKHYREELRLSDLQDPVFLKESRDVWEKIASLVLDFSTRNSG